MKFKHPNFAINVGRYTKTAPEQRIAFASAKSIGDEDVQRLLAAYDLTILFNLTVPVKYAA